MKRTMKTWALVAVAAMGLTACQNDFEEQVEGKNDFGKIAMNLHYVGKDERDIIDFIENVVLNGNDPMKQQRLQFRNDYLLPPNGKTVAENTMDVLLRELC